jgi:hypothetical protein
LWSDWLRPATVLLVTVLLVTGVTTAVPWLAGRLLCRDNLPSGDIYSSDDECVGITDGSYAFGLPAGFEQVLGRIAEQNKDAENLPCGEDRMPVKIGVLTTLTHPNSGARALHQLEGFAAGQARANQPGCSRPLVLWVGHTGKAEQEAEELARRFREDPSIVAVVGFPLSSINAAKAVNALGAPVNENNQNEAHPVPMVAATITAEGFDRDGTRYATGCDEETLFDQGIGHGYFFRVAYRIGSQVEELANYLGPDNRPTMIVTPIETSDPYTCITLNLLRARYQHERPELPEVAFNADDESTVREMAKRVCREQGDVTVFYIARSRDLGRLLAYLAERYDAGFCTATITVVSTSDAARLRVPDSDPNLNNPRNDALQSSAFSDGRLRLVYTPLADPDVLRGEAGKGSEFAELETLFGEAGVDLSHLDDGWAINAYDAVYTVVNAIDGLNVNKPVTRALVRGEIAGFSATGEQTQLAGANGRIGFDNNGNRAGIPVTVRLCPLDRKNPNQTHTVTQIGPPGDRTPCPTPPTFALR